MWREALVTVRRLSVANPWGNPVGPVIPFPEREQRREFLRILEGSGLNGWVFFVAASGFLTDSYNLFASNVILPALSYLYWNSAKEWDIYFNLTTLLASAVGQVVFGVLADMYGRRSLYGIELIIVIISTIGLLQCSPGYMDGGHTTWNISGWLLAWRAVMGFGIGAEYPLSACIAAEWSSAESRGPMMSLVFLMQPLGQLCAYAAGYTILHKVNGQSAVGVDIFWRYVVAIGCVPTLLALSFRLSIPESGRFTFDVLKDERQADTDTSKVYSAGESRRRSVYKIGTPPPGSQFRYEELRSYLVTDGNWLYLFGASACWFLLDFAFFGLGFNDPSMLARLWADHSLVSNPTVPWWLASSDFNNGTLTAADWELDSSESLGLIKKVLRDNLKHGIFTVSIASIVGSVLMVTMVNRVKRRQTLTATFAILAVLLFALAGSFKSLYARPQHDVLIVFWILISFFFNFGPNTLTFIFPAEIFPTRYRCTFFGIAAASGKIGAVVVQLVLLGRPSLRDTSSGDVWGLILSFGFCMVLGALVSRYCLPVVQYRSPSNPDKLRSLPLEDLADGRKHRHNQVQAPGTEMGEERVKNGHAGRPTGRVVRSGVFETDESGRDGSFEDERVNSRSY